MVTLPGMRPNLFPNAENAKPCFGRVSAVSSVNNPMVPVVASMGVNLGAGLESSFVPFLSFAAPFAGNEDAALEAGSEDLVSSGVAIPEEAEGSEEEVTEVVLS